MLEQQYRDIEAKTGAFSRETGITCPAGCGECCTAIDFAVSRPEADRVASFLLDHPAVLERFLAAKTHNRPPGSEGQMTGKSQCPLYDAENSAAHCTVYEARPLLCRTFAFSVQRTKDGTLRYAPCHKFREDAELGLRVDRANDAVQAGRGPALPILPDESISIWSMDPSGVSSAPLTMGPAVLAALQALQYRRGLTES